jgi:dTDP-4-amino-4,6-dideoxygalactose transaminase
MHSPEALGTILTTWQPAMCADPLTDRPIRINRPLLPPLGRLAPYIAEIDAARIYTNFGTMHERLRFGLAAHFHLAEGQVGLANSATSGLIAALFATAGRAQADRPLCICPSYTFVATALAAQACGYTPFLADIDPATWALDPDRLAALPEMEKAGAVLVVAPYGREIDLRAWQAFADRTGCPVIVDAAASFDTLDPAAVRSTRLPVIVSLHATKTLSAAEGGLVLSGDEGVVRRIVAALNFGFETARTSVMPAINGKLSEYHALIGLADLDGWHEKRDGFVRAAQLYTAVAGAAGLGDRFIVNTARATPYAHFVAADVTEAERILQSLGSASIECRRWYGLGLHPQPAFAGCPREVLPVTAALAECLIGLPFAMDLDASDVKRVVGAIVDAVAAGTNMPAWPRLG